MAHLRDIYLARTLMQDGLREVYDEPMYDEDEFDTEEYLLFYPDYEEYAEDEQDEDYADMYDQLSYIADHSE